MAGCHAGASSTQSPHSMCSTATHYLQVFACTLKTHCISRLKNAAITNIHSITILRRCVDISVLFSCRKQKKYTKMWPNNRHERKSSYLCVAPAPRLHSQPPPSVTASALPLLGPAPLCAFIRPPAATARPAPGERGAPVTWSAPGLSWESGSHDELQPCTRAAAGAGRPRGVWRRGRHPRALAAPFNLMDVGRLMPLLRQGPRHSNPPHVFGGLIKLVHSRSYSNIFARRES